MLFEVEIRDYKPGEVDEEMTAERLENVIDAELDRTGSDGVVIVRELAS